MIDLDLLLYDDLTMSSPELVLPHPRMHERAFVLLPMAEMDAGACVPGHGSVQSLLKALDPQRIARIG